LSGAVAINVLKIEGEEDELIRAPFVHRRLEPAEHRHAIALESAELAVDVSPTSLKDPSVSIVLR
jgi:hypothetical protein